MKLGRAYSVLDIKAFDDAKRTFTGIATTPSVDRMDDVVEPEGAEFTLPIPFLWQHDSDNPVGHVTKAKVSSKGIEVEVQLKQTNDPGIVKDRLDAAWQYIKLGLVRGLSIGFQGIETARIEGTYGVRFLKWAWLELSGVTIPANQDASIINIKSIDDELLAASGHKRSVERTVKAGVTAAKSTPVVTAKEAKTMKKTIAEQIAGFEATRVAKMARMDEIMDTAADKGETLAADAKQEYDNLESEVKEVDEHLVRLRNREKSNKAAAVEVKGGNADDAANSRGSGVRVSIVPRKIEPGIGFTRFVLAQARAKGNIMQAYEMAKANEQWQAESPEVVLALETVMKTGIPAGSTLDTGWSNMMVNYQVLQDQFIEYLRPLTIIGRLAGLTRVPFNIKIGRQTGGASVNWVGQGGPKPVTNITGDNVTLDQAKIAGIIVLNDELVRISNPSAELLVRNDLTKAIVQFMDSQFVDPTKSATSGVSPASITNGVTAQIPTGTTGAALRSDMKTLLSTFLTANLQVSGAVILMSQRMALQISMMQNALGQNEYPNLTMNGGEAWGLPVVTSEGVPSTGGSPTDGDPIIVLSAPDILLADDGQVTIDASREATLQMETAPDSPPTASTIYYSLFQNNGVAIRAERYINWVKRRSSAVAYISNGKYFE